MFHSKNFTLLLVLIFAVLHSACSQKSPQTAECGEGTVQQGTAVGTVIGAVAGKLAQTNIFVGAIVGGLIGTISTQRLASLQCQYYGKEKELLQNITHNIEEQNKLAIKTNKLNHKMNLLYQEIEEIKRKDSLQLSKKDTLITKIKHKKEEIKNIQNLNQKVINSTKTYYHSLNNSNFSKADRTSVQKSLNNILSSLYSIENASTYNLSQLKKFKRKIQ